jgi:hypothetical protein
MSSIPWILSTILVLLTFPSCVLGMGDIPIMAHDYKKKRYSDQTSRRKESYKNIFLKLQMSERNNIISEQCQKNTFKKVEG